jgi:hypothetical protein
VKAVVRQAFCDIGFALRLIGFQFQGVHCSV